MRCPHCQFPFGENSKISQADFILCNRCGRIWVDVGSQRPQGLLASPLPNNSQKETQPIRLRQPGRFKAV